MALVEVYISNGNPSDTIIIKDNESHNVDLSNDEILLLNNVVDLLQSKDISNCGWLINNEISAGVYLKHSSIDHEVTCCDKGGNIDEEEDVFADLNTLVNQLISKI